MIIGIDGNEANVNKRVGVSVYTYELLKYFQKSASKDVQFIIYLRNNPGLSLQDDTGSSMPEESQYFIYRIVKGPLWSQIFVPIDLYLNRKIDVFFSPAHYTPRFCPVPVVVTIHDLAYEYYPEEFLKEDLYKLKIWTGHAVKQAKKIIAVSNNTKKDIVKFYHVPEEMIKVIYNGYQQKSKILISKSQINTKYQILNTKYLLYVGTIQPRKNLLTLIETFHLLLQDKPDFKLVIAGKKGWMYEEIYQKVKDLKLTDKIIFTGYINESELSYLYQNASIYILPSLYEGFGIPLLEAMSNNCPIVAANISSLPEIGANACLYFDPNDKMDLKSKIHMILDDEKLRGDLINKGKARVKEFSWEKCGKETLNILRNVSSFRFQA